MRAIDLITSPFVILGSVLHGSISSATPITAVPSVQTWVNPYSGSLALADVPLPTAGSPVTYDLDRLQSLNLHERRPSVHKDSV